DLQGASDSGASSTDNITNITSPVFTLASPGANYHRFYRGGTKIADYLTGTTYTAAGQTDGAWSYQESFVDAAGNESAAGPALAVAIDTVAPTLLSAASRKTHGSAGTFDLALNLGDATTATVEPRRNAAGDLLVFNFSESITGSAGTVSAMQFPATNAAFTAAATSAGVLTLTLNSATDASVVSVGLNGLFDVAGNALAGTTVVYLRVLDGDVNQTTSVSVSDLQGVKNHLLEDVTAGNFLFDVNVSGGISVSDLQEVKNHLLNGVA
ncbi:MAG TPA: Ig-like domain-containing protein, partial [Tepidisphaeraceae bacterium]